MDRSVREDFAGAGDATADTDVSVVLPVCFAPPVNQGLCWLHGIQSSLMFPGVCGMSPASQVGKHDPKLAQGNKAMKR